MSLRANTFLTGYRFFEILPGTLAWLTIILMFILSWLTPALIAIFIILFDIYWLLKTFFLSLHLRITFRKVKENLKINWLDRLEQTVGEKWQEVYHLVIIPMLAEPYEVVCGNFISLLKINYPKDRLIVVLAIEESGGQEAAETAEKIKKEFGEHFFKFLLTVHRRNLPGEIPGKGSNETWAARCAKNFIDNLPQLVPYENILVSVFDADTQVFPEYFGILTYTFLTCENPQRSSFQPIPLFVNNIYQAPALARVISFSSTFWHMMQQARPEQLTTFSSHSTPFKSLIEIDFWNTNVVSEDSQIFWKLYLHYNGNWRTVPLFYPISMDANVAPSFWRTMKNIYKQQRRWAWGVENIPYAFYGFYKNKFIKRRDKFFWTFKKLEAFHSWSTNSLMIFILGWLPLVLGGRWFGVSVLSYNLPYMTRTIMFLAMLGIVSSAILSIWLLPPKPAWFRLRHYFLYFIQWILMPITLIIFGALPALEAQTRLLLGGRWRLGFWTTPKYR